MPAVRLARVWPVLLIAALIGLALRTAAALGGLWLDEAWSAAYARDVVTPAGVLLNINHDNNHHLNTLWLQLVGFGADPLIQRALSIACGTLTVLVAGAIAARRGIEAAAVTAMLFAASPILVTYGSEARGYAPMLLALMGSIALVDRWLDARERPAPAIGLAVLAVLGMLAQLTMAFGLVAIAGWILLRVWRDEGLQRAVAALVRAQAIPLASGVAVAALVFGIAHAQGGFQFGAVAPFQGGLFVFVLGETAAWTFGLPPHRAIAATAIVVTLLALLVVRSVQPRAAFYALAIIGLPAAVALLTLPNSAIGRYYLLSVVALLLLAGEVAGSALRKRGILRWITLAVLCIILVGSAVRDLTITGDGRGDPSRAVAEMAPRAPKGATATVERARAAPVLEVAAASRGYRLALEPCGRFLFVDRDGTEPFPAAPILCGQRYRLIAGADPAGLSGTHWRLYERQTTP